MTYEKTSGKNTSLEDSALAKDYLAVLQSLNDMQDSRNFYASLFEYAPAGYMVLDQKGNIRDINSIGAKLLNAKKSSILNMPLSAYIVQNDIKGFLNHLRRCNKSAKLVQSEVTLVNKHREVQLASAKIPVGGQVCLSTIIVDMSEEKKIQREVEKLGRLQIIGEMAAGIAHEIRNPMTTVLGYLQMFQKKAQMADFHESFSVMTEELHRANAIITEFLSLAKNKAFSPTYLDLNQIVTNLHPLINAEALMQGKNIFIELADTLPLVLIDENEIRQVIHNLTRNGLQAMDSGMLLVRTYIEHDNVVLAVQDHGTGMPKEVQAKIGTPFFTTKATGTGMGLPVCYNIAARHNAILKFETGSEGTTFFLQFGPEMIQERSHS
jgi:PAS domain S-box-containing protein